MEGYVICDPWCDKRVAPLIFSPVFPKTGWAGFQSLLCISRVLPHTKPRWGMFSAHSTHVQCLTAYRTSVRSPLRSRTQNCEKKPDLLGARLKDSYWWKSETSIITASWHRRWVFRASCGVFGGVQGTIWLTARPRSARIAIQDLSSLEELGFLYILQST